MPAAKSAKAMLPEALISRMKASDQGDRPGFQQGQHEQHRPPAILDQPLAEDHDRAAKAHDLPGDQEGDRILHAEHAEGTDQAHGNAEDPGAAGASRWSPARRRAARRAGRIPSATALPASARRSIPPAACRGRSRSAAVPFGSATSAARSGRPRRRQEDTRATRRPRPASARIAATSHAASPMADQTMRQGGLPSPVAACGRGTSAGPR